MAGPREAPLSSQPGSGRRTLRPAPAERLRLDWRREVGWDLPGHLPDGPGELRPRRPGARVLTGELGAAGHGLRPADALPRPATSSGLPARARRRRRTAGRLTRRPDLDVQAPHGFRFSDGSPVRADAFAQAIHRTMAPGVDSPAYQYTRAIVGAEDVHAGRAARASGVTAGENTLTVRFTREVREFAALDDDAVLLRRPADAPAQPGGRAHVPGRRPLHDPRVPAQRTHRARPQPLLRRPARPPRRRLPRRPQRRVSGREDQARRHRPRGLDLHAPGSRRSSRTSV